MSDATVAVRARDHIRGDYMANERKQDDRGMEEVDKELQREERAAEEARDRLVGDMAEDRNLSGSSTWENLAEEETGTPATDRPGESQRAPSGDEAARDADRGGNPPRTTSGGITAPKFGSAGSGGAELEPGPERD
jgi:hypothetical protein